MSTVTPNTLPEPPSDQPASNATAQRADPTSDSNGFQLNQAVVDGKQAVYSMFPVKNAKVISCHKHTATLLNDTAKIVVELPDGKTESYFLKVTLEEGGGPLCEGEFESLKAMHAVSPLFAPKPYGWGHYKTADSQDAHFLLEEFRNILEQPADPTSLAAGLADLHHRSLSPTGKFGFHMKTCHGKIVQEVDQWDSSWAALFGRHLGHIMSLARPVINTPQFNLLCDLTLSKVVPRLLLPLQAGGRVLKPCLIHGDCHDFNTAVEGATGAALVFDACSFYGHNEYDTGNWRTPRHILSDPAYILEYKARFPPSEPAEEWDVRNRLYSLPFNIGNALYIPGSTQKPVVHDDMFVLCKLFCPEELAERSASVGDSY